VDGRRSARAVAAEVDLTERQCFAILAELEELGVVQRVPFAAEEPLVLVISPSHALQRLLRLTVERLGIRTTVVDDGAGAVITARGERPAAIVLDVDGGGWPAVRDLRGVDGLGHVPLLVIGESDGGPLVRWRRPRADVMDKPFDELEVQQWLGRRLGRPLA
jgi:CheY-like chemotaxis protein